MNDEINELLGRIRTGDYGQKIRAIRELGERKNKKAIKPLIHLLEQALGNYEQRFLISPLVQALGALRAHEARHVLFRALQSEFYSVKSDAAEALGHIGGNHRTIRALTQALVSTRAPYAKKHIIDGLAEADGTHSIEPLSQAATQDPDPEVREEALLALGRTGKNEALAPLLDAYNTAADTHIRREVVEALSHIASAGSKEFLIHALSDPDPGIRSGAASALGSMRATDTETPLKRALKDPTREVRESAAKALGLITFLPR